MRPVGPQGMGPGTTFIKCPKGQIPTKDGKGCKWPPIELPPDTGDPLPKGNPGVPPDFDLSDPSMPPDFQGFASALAARGVMPEFRTIPSDEDVILDVRTEPEFQAGHLPGARSLPIEEMPDRMEEIAEATGGDFSKPIKVYCCKGEKSATVCRFLQMAGFQDVEDLGGIEAGVPTISRTEVLR